MEKGPFGQSPILKMKLTSGDDDKIAQSDIGELNKSKDCGKWASVDAGAIAPDCSI